MDDITSSDFFRDALNPTEDELIRWAYTIEPDRFLPMQDWDICITVPERRDLFLRMASDVSCPERKIFLSCLYLLVGDAVRSGGITWSLEEAAAWLQRPDDSLPQDVRLFFQRAAHLIDAPQEFDYYLWCDGGHAREDCRA